MQTVKLLVFILLVLVFLGSPVWTSVLVALLPRGRVGWALGICAVQALLAYVVWWFYWGGGIGGELRLMSAWQAGFVLALLPFGVTAFRVCRRANPLKAEGKSHKEEG